jgi:hypothetical protein
VVEVQATASRCSGTCPGCQCAVVEGARRLSADGPRLARGARAVAVRLRGASVRLRERPVSARATFVGQVPGLTCRYGRLSGPLQWMLASIAGFLAGRAGARLAAQLAVAESRSRLLRLLTALPLPVPGQVSEVGIDDFAFRRDHQYGKDRRRFAPIPCHQDSTLGMVGGEPRSRFAPERRRGHALRAGQARWLRQWEPRPAPPRRRGRDPSRSARPA